MGRGDSGSDVEQLQRYLRRLGLPEKVDGEYGSDTSSNVKDWEAWRYKRVNGRVGLDEAEAIERQAKSGAAYRQRRHVFPIRGAHDYGASGSRFGFSRGSRAGRFRFRLKGASRGQVSVTGQERAGQRFAGSAKVGGRAWSRSGGR
jgi:hypothetical protein